jgi:DHA1 family tetracycline resistance protein-like MFS transporter
MGLLGASFGVGFLLGPAIGGALAPFGYAVPLLFAAGLATAKWTHAWWSLQEPPGQAHGDGEASRGRIAPLRDPLVRRLCAANGVFSVAVAQLETVFAFFMMDRFGYDAQHVAGILVGMALVMGGVQGGAMRVLAARFGERALAIAGSALLAACFAVLPAFHRVAWLLVPLALSAIGRAVVQPSLLSMTSLAATPAQRGAVMGAFQSAASLARVVGPLAAGVLYDVSQPAPFWLASALLVATALLGARLPGSVASAAPAGSTRSEAGGI